MISTKSNKRSLDENLKRARSRLLEITLALVLACAGTLTFPFDSQAASDTELVWLYGDDRYETAAEIALAAYPDGAQTVLIASGASDKMADSISASSLAGLMDAPILLTKVDELPESTSSALEELGTQNVVIIGGTASVSANVERQLTSAGFTIEDRLAGDSRMDTQALIYSYGQNYGDWNNNLVFITNGYSIADSLSISSIAFSQHFPIFITSGSGTFSSSQIEIFLDEFANSQVVVIGGTASVSTRTMSFINSLLDAASLATNGTLAQSATRIWGNNRYETSCSIAEWAVNSGYLDWNHVAVADGSTGIDALVGGVLQGKSSSVLLLTSNNNQAAIELLAKYSSEIEELRFFGGSGRFGSELVALITDALDIT